MKPLPRTCIAIGNFDGVHLGHQALIQRVVTAAQTINAQALVLTFDPHPARVLRPDSSLPALTTSTEKQTLLIQYGIHRVIVQPFDLLFAQKTPEAFVEEVLLPLRPAQVFVGQDFCFGHARAGTAETLAQLGALHGFDVHATPLVSHNAEPVSSSRIRRALTEGDIPLVTALLGRPFDVTGTVVRGDQRGRTIGIPTANLATQAEILPKRGVYVVRASWEESNETVSAYGLMNIGVRPTLQQVHPTQTIEVHLLDVSPDLYEKTLRVECLARLRDEQSFPDLQALQTQIHQDIANARTMIS